MRKRQDEIFKAEKIFRALSAADPELLERSEKHDLSSRTLLAAKYGRVAAACLCLVLAGSAVWLGTVFYGSSEGTKAGGTELSAQSMVDGDGGELIARDETGVQGARTDAQDEMGESGQKETGRDKITCQEKEESVLNEMGGSETIQAPEAAAESEELKGEGGLAENREEIIGFEIDQADAEEAPLQDGYRSISEAEAKELEVLGDYVPQRIPSGFVFESGHVDRENSAESVYLCYTAGMDAIRLNIRDVSALNESVLIADVAKKEQYDVNLYEIPYADTVPEAYRKTFDHPVFAEADFTEAVVASRMKGYADNGDTDTPRGNFAVLYEKGILVEFNGRGSTEEIWDMFCSISAR